MTEAIVIFAVIFGACMFAIGAFAADAWVRAKRIRGIALADRLSVSHGCDPRICDCGKPRPYSPPMVRRIDTSQSTGHAPHCAFSGPWCGIIPPQCTCGGIVTTANPATFQRLAVDSADERGAWGPTA